MLLILRETPASPGEGTGMRSSYRIPFKNSAKFPKDIRSLHLQDGELFDALSLESVTNQMAIWSQTKATQEATALKAKKNDETGNKENTQIKIVKVQEGNTKKSGHENEGVPCDREGGDETGAVGNLYKQGILWKELFQVQPP